MNLQFVLKLLSAWQVGVAGVFVVLLLPLAYALAARRSAPRRKVRIAAPSSSSPARTPITRRAKPATREAMPAVEEE